MAILAEKQAGRPNYNPQRDRPLAEAKELVNDPAAFTREMTRILRDKRVYPLIAQMMKPAENSDPPPPLLPPVSSSGDPRTTSHEQFQ